MLPIAARAQYPRGILLVHEELRACFFFRATVPPRLVSFACCLRLLHPGCAAGFMHYIAEGSDYVLVVPALSVNQLEARPPPSCHPQLQHYNRRLVEFNH